MVAALPTSKSARGEGASAFLLLRHINPPVFRRNDLLYRDIRMQVVLDEPREVIRRGGAVVATLGIDTLHDKESVSGIVAQGGALAVSPIPAAAHGAFVIEVGELAGEGGVGLVFSERQERISAIGHAQAHVTSNRIQVLASQRKSVFKRDGVVDVDRGRDRSHGMVFQYALQKILDAAAGTSLGLETPIRLAPNLHRFNLRDGRAGEKALGACVRATQQVGKLLPVIFGHVLGGQHVPRDHDAERSARKQLPKRVLGNKTVHNVLLSNEKHAYLPTTFKALTVSARMRARMLYPGAKPIC